MACDTAKSWQIQIIDCQLFYFFMAYVADRGISAARRAEPD